MAAHGLAEADSGAAQRLYLMYGDSTFAPAAADALRAALPPAWVLADEPEGASAILAVGVPVDADLLDRAGPGLRLIAVTEPEVDAVPTDRGEVRVLTIPTESQMSRLVVAEHTVMMILALYHNLIAIARTTVEDPWAPDRDTPSLTDQATYVYNWTDFKSCGFLLGKTVGIIGVGAIGRVVAEMLAPYRGRLLYTQRHRLPAAEERRLGLEWREFDDLIRESDVVTLNHRLVEGPGGNEGQFGTREFAMMKPTAFLVNTARGRLIDEEALVAALRDNEIAGVALDVFHYEPLPKDHPLLALAGDRVILTPHLASASEDLYWDHVLRMVLEADGSYAPQAQPPEVAQTA